MEGLIQSTTGPDPLPVPKPIVIQKTLPAFASDAKSVVSESDEEEEARRDNDEYREIEYIADRPSANLDMINWFMKDFFTRSENDMDNFLLVALPQYEEDVASGEKKNTFAWRLFSNLLKKRLRKRRERLHAAIDAEED